MGPEERFEVFKDAAGEWRWRLQAANGRIVATGAEGYDSAAGAKEGIRDTVRAIGRSARQTEDRIAALVADVSEAVVQLEADGALGYSDDELKGTARDGETG